MQTSLRPHERRLRDALGASGGGHRNILGGRLLARRLGGQGVGDTAGHYELEVIASPVAGGGGASGGERRLVGGHVAELRGQSFDTRVHRGGSGRARGEVAHLLVGISGHSVSINELAIGARGTVVVHTGIAGRAHHRLADGPINIAALGVGLKHIGGRAGNEAVSMVEHREDVLVLRLVRRESGVVEQ